MTLGGIALVIALLSLAVPLVALARRLAIPYPVVLVAGGLILGFLPGMPAITLDPNWVLLIFLPPLLYWEAITAPTDVMRANAGQIGLLAIGLATVTAAIVAIVVHATIPGFTWAAALVLGAIVAPTDELASVVVLARLSMPRYVIAVIEGESLLNDASALLIYSVAVGAIGGGNLFSAGTLLHAVVAAVAGVALGVGVGQLAVYGWRVFRDTELQKTISFIMPFASFIPAQWLGLSAVFSTVFAGVRVNQATPVVLKPATRIEMGAYWETIVFLVNALLFLLLGLQLHAAVVAATAAFPVHVILRDALFVNAAIIVTRFVWVIGQEFVPVGAVEHPEPNVRHAAIVAWSGIRGAVSLAAALAVPIAIDAGHPGTRALIIVVAFSVILVTLVLGGLTLPFAVRALRTPGDVDVDALEELRGAAAMSQAAIARLEQLQKDGEIDDAQAALLREQFAARHAFDGMSDSPLLRAERSMLAAERQALVDLRRRGGLDNTVLRRLLHNLDLTEVWLLNPLPEPGEAPDEDVPEGTG